MFSINSLSGFNFITRNVWLSYSQPTDIRFTNIGNIPSSIEVSMYLKTTFNTFEGMAFPVSFNRRKTDILFENVDSMHTFIISNSREWFAHRKFFKFYSLERFTGNISDSLKNRTRKFRMLFSNTVISSMVDRYFAASMVFKTVSGNFIKNLITQNHCLSKRFFVFIRQFQFKFNRSIHIHILQLINVNILCLRGGGVRFLSVLKYGVSSAPAPRRTK